MRGLLVIVAACLAPSAAAQVTVTPEVTKQDVATIQSTMPQPATSAPPSVSDSSLTGSMTSIYALANHTHASKARKGRVLVPASGTFDAVFSTPFTTGVAPLCVTTAETIAGDTNVVNSQIDGVTTATGFRMRITRTAVTNASLLGLNILSVPTQIATYGHFVCLEP